MDDNHGTLTLNTFVTIGGRDKKVTLATFHVCKEECEETAQGFRLFNPQFKNVPIFAEFVRRERFAVRAE